MKHCSWILAVMLSVTGIASLAKSADPESKSEFDRGAERIMGLIDSVMKRHIEPPARQQLVLVACRVISKMKGLESSAEISSTVSSMTTSAEFSAFLSKQLRSVGVNPTRTTHQLTLAAMSQIASSLSPDARLIEAKEERVQSQLAANRYVGMGIGLSMRDDLPVMTRVFANGPTFRAGAKNGDSIEQINGESTKGKNIRQIVDLLRGPKDSKVEVVLRQPTPKHGQKPEAREYTIVRGVVPLTTVHQNVVTSKNGTRLVHVTFDKLTASTVQELAAVENMVQTGHVQGVLLDFRGRINHSLHHAVLFGNALLDGESIGRVQTRTGERAYQADRDCLFRDVPMTVLVDGGTRGTFEWIAAALQRSKRAKIVGSPTAGHGFVTSTVELPNDDLVVVLRTGRLKQVKGPLQQVRPDVSARPLPIGRFVEQGIAPIRKIVEGNRVISVVDPRRDSVTVATQVLEEEIKAKAAESIGK
jgi:C-terminal peptidase prc